MGEVTLSRVEIASLGGDRLKIMHPRSKLSDVYQRLGEFFDPRAGRKLWYLNATVDEIYTPEKRQHFSTTIFQPNRAVVTHDECSYHARIHAMKLGRANFNSLSDLFAEVLERKDSSTLKDMEFDICGAGNEMQQGLVTVTPFSFLVGDGDSKVRYEFSEQREHTYKKCPRPDW